MAESGATIHKPLAVVTGATGFVASQLVQLLLSKGFDVRGTVRSLKSHRSQELLSSAPGPYSGALELREADLLGGTKSFSEALQGADYLFHVASPFVIDVEDPQNELIEPALQGTRNVLNAAAEHKATLKRVIVTSSVAGNETTYHNLDPVALI